MFVGQVGEPALDRREIAIGARLDEASGDGERAFVAGEHPRRVAEYVAGELVEDDDQRERRFGPVRLPVIESSGERVLDELAETRADLGVESRILAEPDIARRPETFGAEP